MAAIAVLPVLIGLAVDYAIQFQSRVEEEGDVAGGGRAGAPTIATAALATATGFLVLLLSPIPMVRGFGLLLVIGIGIAFAVTLTAGSAALALAGRASGRPGRSPAPARGARPCTALGHPPDRSPHSPEPASCSERGALRASLHHPARVLGVAFSLAAVGWVVETQTRVAPTCASWFPATCRRSATSTSCRPPRRPPASSTCSWRARTSCDLR